MNVGALLDELRERDVRLEADDLVLRVDAPEGVVTGELREQIREHRRALIRLLERERKNLEKAIRRDLIVNWSREPAHVSGHDPTTGVWHELSVSGCPRWVLDEARAHYRCRGARP